LKESYPLKTKRGLQPVISVLVVLLFGMATWLPADTRSGLFTLTDPAGAPVAQATVTIVGSSASATTDDSGRFSLSPMPSLPMVLSIFSREGVWLGYVRINELTGPGPHRLRLPPLDRVEVTLPAGSTPQTLAPPAAATTVVTRAERNGRRPARLVEVLAEVPGAQQLGSGQGAVPSLRGLSRGRTLLLLDDARITTERRAGASATYLDPFSIESIEIVRGPGSVAYGSDALGGIIHSRTPQPRPDQTIVRLVLSADSASENASGGIEANLPAGKGAVLVQSHQRSFADYRSPERRVPGSAARDRGLLIKWLLPPARSRWTFGIQADEAIDVGKPTATAADTEVSYPEEQSLRFTAHAELPPPAWLTSTSLHLFAGSYQLVTQRDTRLTASSTRQIDRSDVRSTDASLRWSATMARENNVLHFGLDAGSRLGLAAAGSLIDFDMAGKRISLTRSRSIESADRYDAGIYIEDELLIADGRISLLGGLRGQGVWTRNNGGLAGNASTSRGTATGYAAGTWRFKSPWMATLQIARGFREPTLSDRYFTGISGRGFIQGNPELEPETTRQIDLSVRRPGTRWNVASYLYEYRIFDLIERFRTSGTAFAFRNRGESRIRGFELEASVNLPARFTLRGSFNLARGETPEDGRPTDDVPGPSVVLSVQQSPMKRLWWRLGYFYKFEDTRPGPNELRTPGYAVIDLAAGWTFNDALELRLVGSNLLDNSHPASPDEESVTATGINAAVILEGRF
jgi:outer membrane receptor protein involved in Fe transport